MCILLYVSFIKFSPCSYSKINSIEDKIYIFLLIVNLLDFGCYFYGLYVSIGVVALLIVLTVIFFGVKKYIMERSATESIKYD